MKLTRRALFRQLVGASLSVVPAGRGGPLRAQSTPEDLGFPVSGRRWHGDSSVGTLARTGLLPESRVTIPRDVGFDWAATGVTLRQRFRDVRRHFVFEYYPWYETDPWMHWDEADRHPPVDIASNYMPRLGPYDSRSSLVLEQHARWIAECGVGAINLSWWGPGSTPDRIAHRVMDVMRAHDIHVTFHLEPYSDRHGYDFARDVLYLLKEFGERRRWDALLLLEDDKGRSGPVFKGFRTILPREVTDCHGIVYQVPDYTPDAVWHGQTDRIRTEVRQDFDHVTLLADSLDMGRTASGGFDGIAIYDNYVRPDTWADTALACASRDLLFSFNINPGYDGIEVREVPPGSCYRPPKFEPRGDEIDWGRPEARERARRLATSRVLESARTTLSVQTDPALSNARRGFLLVYINSFNEWHEGHQFEPMKDVADLTKEERAVRYRNPSLGGYRLDILSSVLRPLVVS